MELGVPKPRHAARLLKPARRNFLLNSSSTPQLLACAQGDPGIESIYAWGAKQNIDMRGANGAGDGVHVLTGPIAVRGAEKGDVLQVYGHTYTHGGGAGPRAGKGSECGASRAAALLWDVVRTLPELFHRWHARALASRSLNISDPPPQVDILDLYPRVNPSTGKTYGSNAAAWWGYQYRMPYKTGQQKREFATIYEVRPLQLVASRADHVGTHTAPAWQRS